MCGTCPFPAGETLTTGHCCTLQSQSAGRAADECAADVPRPGDSQRGAKHHTEHDIQRGYESATAALPAVLRVRRSLAILRPIC